MNTATRYRIHGSRIAKRVRDASTRCMEAGLLFEICRAFRTQWYCGGRIATRVEVLESIETGLPILRAANHQERTEKKREVANRMLDQELAEAMKFVPRV
jgi:hypothetical protein